MSRSLRFALVISAFAALAALSGPAAATTNTEWVGPTEMDNGVSGMDPSVAMNSNGTAVAAWWTNTEAWASFFSNSVWDAPARLNVDHEFAWQVMAPQADIDEAGRAVVCWMVYYLDSNNATEWGEAYAALYTPGVGWTAERLLGPADFITGDTPACAIGLGGRAFVAFQDSSDPNTTYERLAVYTPGSSWQPLTNLASNASGNLPAYARVAADEQVAVVAWDVLDDTFSGLASMATTYTVADGWSSAYSMDAGGGGTGLLDVDVTAGTARLLMLGQGASANRTAVLYSWSMAGDWTGPIVVAGPGPALRSGILAADPGGNFTVSWTTQPNGTTRDLWGRYYGATTGWDNVTLLEELDGRVQTRGVAPDQNGGALMVFVVFNAGYNTTYWVRYVPGSGWRPPASIHATAETLAGVSVASSPTQALALWYEDNGTAFRLQAYELVRDDEEPFVAIASPAELLYNTSTVRFEGIVDVRWRMWFEGAPLVPNAFGIFRFDLTLADGAHTFTLVAWDDDLNVRTMVMAFTVDTVSNLQILEPAEGFVTSALVAGIRGMAEPGSTVTVGGVPIPVAANGTFSYLALLAYGNNGYELVAVDVAGNRANATVNIGQVLPDLGIDEARAEIANLTANLSAAEAELDAALADLAAIEAEANASAADLASAQARVGRAEDNVSALQAQLTAATAAAAQAEARAKASQDAAAGASTLAMLGLALGAAGLAVGMLALMRGRKTDAEPRGQAPMNEGSQK